MILYPETMVFRVFILGHPLWFSAFVLSLSPLILFFFKNVFLKTEWWVEKAIYFLALVAALMHLILLSALIVAYQAARILYNDKLEPKREWKRLLTAAATVALVGVGWLIYLNVVDFLDPKISVDGFGLARKLLNYPKIFEKVLLPVFQLDIFYEFMLFFVGCMLVIWAFLSNSNVSDAIARPQFAATLFITLVCFSATGTAKTYYNHIRYIYYVYPLMLIVISTAMIFGVSTFRKYASSKFVVSLAVAAYCFWQISFAWTHILHARPGDREAFSYSRHYIDHKTCCMFLTKNKGPGDLVIAFASAHQSAAYCGSIDICSRPALKEHTDERHYITGSLYYDSVGDLISAVENAGGVGTSVWVIFYGPYFNKDDWEPRFINHTESRAVCDAGDGSTRLLRFEKNDFLNTLLRIKSVKTTMEHKN